MWYRNIGIAAKEFSSLMNPSCRMDGALFIRETKPLKKASLDIVTEHFDFINRFKSVWIKVGNLISGRKKYPSKSYIL